MAYEQVYVPAGAFAELVNRFRLGLLDVVSSLQRPAFPDLQVEDLDTRPLPLSQLETPLDWLEHGPVFVLRVPFATLIVEAEILAGAVGISHFQVGLPTHRLNRRGNNLTRFGRVGLDDPR